MLNEHNVMDIIISQMASENKARKYKIMYQVDMMIEFYVALVAALKKVFLLFYVEQKNYQSSNSILIDHDSFRFRE